MRQSVRTWSAGIVTAAVAAGSVGAAVAVASPPSTQHRAAVAAAQAFSAKASVKNVRAWQQFRIRGVARNVPPGTRVTLQQKTGGRGWATLPASVNTNSRSAYSMRVVLGMRGHNELRLVDARGQAVSPVMDVWVR